MFGPGKPGSTYRTVRPARQTENPRVAVSQETIGSSLWTLEIQKHEAETQIDLQLADLAERAEGKNPFFEPAFQHAAAGRIGVDEKRLMVLSEKLGEETSLRLAFPFEMKSVGFPPIGVLRAFSHPFAPLSLPLVDKLDLEETLARFAGLLVKLDLPKPLVFEDFPVCDPIAKEMFANLKAHGLTAELTNNRRRAAICAPGSAILGAGLPWLKPKRRQEAARLLRLLSQIGNLEFEKAERVWDVLVRFEEFLVLETRGWKGRKGSSIHIIRKTAAFARQAVAALASQGRAAIYSLRLNGKVVASLIMLRSGNRYFPWKTAFDERYGAYSPGTLLMQRATLQLLSTPGFEFADSLAREHSWMERLWPDQINFATLVISQDQTAARRVVKALGRASNAKAIVKSLLQAVDVSRLRRPQRGLAP